MPRGYLTAFQAEIRQRLAAGERIVGPVQVFKPKKIVRRFAWPNGSAAHARIIESMIATGVVEQVPLGDGRHEIVLKGATS